MRDHPNVSGPTGGSGGKADSSTGGGGESGKGESGKGGESGSSEAGTGSSGESGSGGKAEAGSGSGGDTAPADAGIDFDKGSNEVTPGKICERLAQILCASEAKCCDNPGRDIAACETAQMATCTGDWMADAIASQKVAAFNPTQAKAVFDEIEKRAKACDTTIAEFSESGGGLRSIFDGTVAGGGSCLPLNASDKAMAGGALAACKERDTFACLPSALSWKCAKRGDVGTQCFTDINCLAGQFCDNPQLDIKGDKCQERKADGESCAQLNECKSLYCKSGKCVAADQQTVYCLED